MIGALRKYVGFAVLLAAACWLGGCYHVGGLSHPQLKTIAVAPVENDTMLFNGSAVMRDLLCELFMLDGSLKLVSLSEADCIVYARLVNYSVSDAGDNSYDQGRGIYVPAEWSITVGAEFSVSIPGQATPLLDTRKVVGNAVFQKNIDQYLSRDFGVQQACRDAADKIVTLTTEAW